MRVEAIQLTPLQEGLIFFITGTILLIAALFACIQSSVEFSSGATVTAEIEQIQRERRPATARIIMWSTCATPTRA